jgi:hypothetical protein
MQAPPSAFDVHCGQVARALLDGRVVPLLGAGANLCGRQGVWRAGMTTLPSGAELAKHLADHFYYPETSSDLVRIAQYVTAMLGEEPLYDELHELFGGDYEPTELHRFLAALPAIVRSQENVPRDAHQLIVTTNYDDALELAFREAGEEFDLVSYICGGDDRGRFLHRTPAGELTVIERANEYSALSLERRTVILKIHGAIDREDPERDSYVITEDDYIDYLTRTDVSQLLPVTLVAKLRKSHTLFLGYSLRDWNLRAIFHRIWQERTRRSNSWAIQKGPDTIDARFWQNRGVEILDRGLEEYVDALAQWVGALAAGEARAA